MKLANNEAATENPYQVVLSTGRVVTFREMVTSDLIFMEKLERDAAKSSTERTIAMIERLSVGNKITQPEIKKLKLSDFSQLADLMNTAGGFDAEENDGDGDDDEEL